jgi:hypothetical protein
LRSLIKRTFSAPLTDQLLIFYAFMLASLVRFCVFFLPFKMYRSFLGVRQTEADKPTDKSIIDNAVYISKIVLSVCRHTPWESKCLIQAIVCKKILLNKGVNTTLYLGVAQERNKNSLAAHAWLKLGDTVLTGERGHKKFNVVNFYG